MGPCRPEAEPGLPAAPLGRDLPAGTFGGTAFNIPSALEVTLPSLCYRSPGRGGSVSLEKVTTSGVSAPEPALSRCQAEAPWPHWSRGLGKSAGERSLLELGCRWLELNKGTF